MEIRNAQPTIDVDRVTVRESDLLEAICVALESGEFRQIRRLMRDDTDGRCAYGVADTIGRRAGLSMVTQRDWDAVIPRDVEMRAALRLGYGMLGLANDAGVTFAEIAQALREAREELHAAAS